MVGKIIFGLIFLSIIGAFAYVALMDVDIPQQDITVEIQTNPIP